MWYNMKYHINIPTRQSREQRFDLDLASHQLFLCYACFEQIHDAYFITVTQHGRHGVMNQRKKASTRGQHQSRHQKDRNGEKYFHAITSSCSTEMCFLSLSFKSEKEAYGISKFNFRLQNGIRMFQALYYSCMLHKGWKRTHWLWNYAMQFVEIVQIYKHAGILRS